MILTLEITGPREGPPPAESRKAFPCEGRNNRPPAGQRLGLPDPYVSSRHARIRYANGVFHIEDTSSANGVFVKLAGEQADTRSALCAQVGRSHLHRALRDSGLDQRRSAKAIDDPFALDPFDRATPPPAVLASAPPIIPVDPLTSSSEEVDPLRALGFDARASTEFACAEGRRSRAWFGAVRALSAAAGSGPRAAAIRGTNSA